MVGNPNYEKMILETMAKMADAVSDPKRLKALQATMKAQEEAAKKLAAGRKLEDAERISKEIVEAARVKMDRAEQDAARIRIEAETFSKEARAEDRRAKAVMKDRESAVLERERNAGIEEDRNKAEANRLTALETELQEEKARLAEERASLEAWAERLSAAAAR